MCAQHRPGVMGQSDLHSERPRLGMHETTGRAADVRRRAAGAAEATTSGSVDDINQPRARCCNREVRMAGCLDRRGTRGRRMCRSDPWRCAATGSTSLPHLPLRLQPLKSHSVVAVKINVLEGCGAMRDVLGTPRPERAERRARCWSRLPACTGTSWASLISSPCTTWAAASGSTGRTSGRCRPLTPCATPTPGAKIDRAFLQSPRAVSMPVMTGGRSETHRPDTKRLLRGRRRGRPSAVGSFLRPCAQACGGRDSGRGEVTLADAKVGGDGAGERHRIR
jgi:hypothetical protein